MSFWGFLLLLFVVFILCRALASLFPIIKGIVWLVIVILAIAIWCMHGFWLGLLALFGGALVGSIFFDITTDETDPKTYTGSSSRPSSGLTCQNCNSTNTVKLDRQEMEELCNLQYRENGYNGTMADAYKCNDCGYYLWYDRSGKIFYTHP